MSRNGSGAYSSPASSFPAVAATLIESTKYNNVINDLAAAMTASIANDGQTPILANLPMGGFKLTGLAAGAASGDSVRYDELILKAPLAGSTTQAFSASTLNATALLDLSAATAGQIKFPATQNASANVNTLDDYETGTWTPGITAGTGSITSYTSSGTYTKIGRTVMCTIAFSITNNGTGAGTCTLSGLPFALLNGYSAMWRRGGADGVFCILSNNSLFNSANGYPLATGVNDQFTFFYQTT